MPKFFLRCFSVTRAIISGTVLLYPAVLAGQRSMPPVNLTLSSGELKASKAFDAARKRGSPELYAFLREMPKGADLHMHLSGAVYAETFIADAVKLGMCVTSVSVSVPAVPLSQGAVKLVPPVNGKEAGCPPNAVPASDALQNQALYDDMIDSFSMRGYVPTPGISGHDQFFSTFGRFSGLDGMLGEWLDELATRASTQNEQYLEVMHTPPSSHAVAAAVKAGWPSGLNDSNYRVELPKLRDALLAGALREDVLADEQEFARVESARRNIEHCGVTDHSGDVPACSVKVHWLYQVLRGYPPLHVFAQTLLAFEVASGDPEVVGLNFVMPEDGRVSMQDYHLQMLMLDYLHGVYPQVHITLHAGELVPGMVPPEGLSFHIREAVELGHAERIGHGADVLYEHRPADLLKEMAQKHVMVEVNLTSNDVILGVKGTDSPLAAYRAAHVPLALSTDDEGVSRIDLTHEYVRGATEQNLTYADLKNMARTSLEHSFLHGESLWKAPDDFARRKAPCAAAISASSKPGGSCQALLSGSERAQSQWELERRFAQFEANTQ